MGSHQQNMGIGSHRALTGGAGARLNPNPAHGGNQPLHGAGPSLVPNGTATEASARHRAMSMQQIPHLVRAGRMEHRHGMQLMVQHQAHLDKHASMKRAAAMKASRPQRERRTSAALPTTLMAARSKQGCSRLAAGPTSVQPPRT
jgi:hypothetical protein